MEYKEAIMGHQIRSTEYQEAILECQAFMECQEASMQYKEAFYGIQRRSVEYKEAIREYREAFM